MFFDIKIGAVAFITYFLPVIATFFFFSNCVRSKTQINFIIPGLGSFLYYRFFMLYLMRYLAMLTSKRRLLI
jgi:hypothetical protein